MVAPVTSSFAGDVGAGHVLGRYELLLPIASGGMAMVWAARLKGTRGFQKIVAVKTMLPKLSDDPQFEQMFLDEASLAAQLRHPHVVETLDLGEQDGVLYMVMEWIDGVPLHQIFKSARKGGGIPLPIAVRIVMQACAGLHTAHELRDAKGQLVGLVHRDISPQNILVTFDGAAKVVDFGVAKVTARGDGATAAGQVKGKVAYMAPEQIKAQDIDRRVDVFAIGVVLYLLTTGKHPFRQDSEAATLFSICEPRAATAPHKLVPGYPMMLERIVMQALAKDPAKRYPTANDLARALDQSLPRNLRASTDEEVGAFMRTLFADRREQQAAALAAALETADKRGAQPAQKSLRQVLDSQPPAPMSGASGITGGSGSNSLGDISGITGALAAGGSLPTATESGAYDALADLTGPGNARASATTPREGVAFDAIPIRKSRAPLVVAAVLVVASLLGALAFFMTQKAEVPPEGAPVTARETVTATPTPEVKPVEPAATATAVAEPEPEPEPEPAAPEPSAKPAANPGKHPIVAKPPTPAARPATTAKPAPATGWKHDPGF